MDLVVYMGRSSTQHPLEKNSLIFLLAAVRVFKVTQLQMAVLLLLKMLGQRTIETYIHQSVGGGACCHGHQILQQLAINIFLSLSSVSCQERWSCCLKRGC
jgi:hypothetical protein